MKGNKGLGQTEKAVLTSAPPGPALAVPPTQRGGPRKGEGDTGGSLHGSTPSSDSFSILPCSLSLNSWMTLGGQVLSFLVIRQNSSLEVHVHAIHYLCWCVISDFHCVIL